MHVLAIYAVKEHLGRPDGGGRPTSGWPTRQARKPETSRFALVTSLVRRSRSAASFGSQGAHERRLPRPACFLDNPAGGLLPARLHPPGHRTPPRGPAHIHAETPVRPPRGGRLGVSGRLSGRGRAGVDVVEGAAVRVEAPPGRRPGRRRVRARRAARGARGGSRRGARRRRGRRATVASASGSDARRVGLERSAAPVAGSSRRARRRAAARTAGHEVAACRRRRRWRRVGRDRGPRAQRARPRGRRAGRWCAAGSRATSMRSARPGGSGGTAASGARTRTIAVRRLARRRSRAWWSSGRPSKVGESLSVPKRRRRAAGEHDRRRVASRRVGGRGGVRAHAGRASSGRGRGRRPSGGGARAGRGPRGSRARSGGWCRSRRGTRPGSAAPLAAIVERARGRGPDTSSRPTRGRPRGGRSACRVSSARMPSGGQPASRAAADSDGGAATASAASSRSIASRTSRRQARPRGPGRGAGRRPGRAPRPRSPRSTTSPGDRVGRRRVRASPGGGPRARGRRGGPAAARPGDVGLGGVVRRDERRSPAARSGAVDVRRETRRHRRLDERAMEVEPGCRIAAGRRQRRRALGREAPARDAARRERVEDDAAARGRAGRRLAEREPVAGRGRDRPRRGGGSRATLPSGRSIASRGPRTTSASTWSVPRWSRRRSRSAGDGGGLARRAPPDAERDEDPRRGDDPGIGGQDGAARDGRRLDAAEQERGPAAGRRPRPSPRGPGPRGRARRASPGTSRSVSPGATGPPRRLPVTTVPRPLHREDPVDREPRRAPVRRRRPSTRAASAPSARAHAVDPLPRLRRRERAPATPASVVRASSASTSAASSSRRAASVARSAFVTTASPSPDPERVEQLEVLERLGVRPVVRRDDEQRRVDLARPDEHVADEPVVARHVDEVDRPARRRARGARTRRRSSSRAAAPRGAGRRRCR